ncbi:MAG: DUF3501 family protein [Gammaproteobacteria bacterium]|nr:DUF3501 family protein [Gammaproteobacteria bacterium]
MNKLTRADLLSLERYAGERAAFRARVIAHKKARCVALGANVNLLFEDRLTVQYQVQEMLRIERIFEAAGIQEELDAYNPLIPDGGNLKATMLLEFTDAIERAERLSRLGGIEKRVYVEVDGHARHFAHADDELERSNDDRTSAVHFLRFEFTVDGIAALKSGRGMSIGIDDPRISEHLRIPDAVVAALVNDFGA